MLKYGKNLVLLRTQSHLLLECNRVLIVGLKICMLLGGKDVVQGYGAGIQALIHGNPRDGDSDLSVGAYWSGQLRVDGLWAV